ncbi:root phototropism protein 3-like [Primulina tabacum]|uniref:root phototropism protein 3-like n=1 Tax=Primulina tabacum TaxID=48773 RepID=UPI003F5A11DB
MSTKTQKPPVALPESITLSGKLSPLMATEIWFDDACILDLDNFVKKLSSIKGKGVRPDLVGSIITHYASKWLPDLAADESERTIASFEDFPESITASWMKKRFFIETLVGILPQEKDSIPCNFLLRMLRVANMVNVDADCLVELEKRVCLQLDQASLKELMIPCFSHTSTTLLDVELILRLVKKFVSSDNVSRTGAALLKVAKLVDSYLAEAAVDSHLMLPEFVALAGVLPSHARSTDDGLYRAIDTYLKAHPGVSKQDRTRLCSLIDSRKLSSEASLHAAQNERLPVRAVIQVLLSEQSKVTRHMEWSGSLSVARSPGIPGLELPARCLSKREMNVQQMEIKRLKEDVLRLQSQCMAMERQIEKMLEKKKQGGYFSWKKLGFPVFRPNKVGGVVREGELVVGVKTAGDTKPRLVRGRTSTKWRKSVF